MLDLVSILDDWYSFRGIEESWAKKAKGIISKLQDSEVITNTILGLDRNIRAEKDILENINGVIERFDFLIYELVNKEEQSAQFSKPFLYIWGDGWNKVKFRSDFTDHILREVSNLGYSREDIEDIYLLFLKGNYDNNLEHNSDFNKLVEVLKRISNVNEYGITEDDFKNKIKIALKTGFLQEFIDEYSGPLNSDERDNYTKFYTQAKALGVSAEAQKLRNNVEISTAFKRLDCYANLKKIGFSFNEVEQLILEIGDMDYGKVTGCIDQLVKNYVKGMDHGLVVQKFIEYANDLLGTDDKSLPDNSLDNLIEQYCSQLAEKKTPDEWMKFYKTLLEGTDPAYSALIFENSSDGFIGNVSWAVNIWNLNNIRDGFIAYVQNESQAREDSIHPLNGIPVLCGSELKPLHSGGNYIYEAILFLGKEGYQLDESHIKQIFDLSEIGKRDPAIIRNGSAKAFEVYLEIKK